MINNLLSVTQPQYKELVRKILESPGYLHLKNPIKEFFQALAQHLGKMLSDWLIKTLGSSAKNAVNAPWLGYAILAVGVLILIGILIALYLSFRNGFGRGTRDYSILGETITADTTPEGFRQKALSCRAEGDFRQAIRFDFIALLLLFHRNNRLKASDSQTNYEVYRVLEQQSFPLLDQYRMTSVLFNAVWYGHKPCTESDYDGWLASLDVIWNEVISHGR